MWIKYRKKNTYSLKRTDIINGLFVYLIKKKKVK